MALGVLAPTSLGFAQEFEQRWQRPGPEVFPLAQNLAVDIAADPSGNMYLVGGHSQLPPFLEVAKLSPSGDLLDQWGPFDGALGEFDASLVRVSVATDASGEFVYFTDPGNCRVQRFRNDGTDPIAFGSCGSGAGQFSSADAIQGLAVSPVTGDVYVGNLRDGVLRFGADGEFLGSWGVPDFFGRRLHGVTALAVDPGGDVWAAIVDGFWVTTAQVARFTGDGDLLDLWPLAGETCPEGPSGNALNNLIWDMVVDSGGVYVTSYGFDRIEKYTREGVCVHGWGVPTGVVPGQGEIRVAPSGLGLAPNGDLLAADHGALREFTQSGAHVRTILRQGYDFGAVAVDALRDRIYVGASGGNPDVLRIYDLQGHIQGYWTDSGDRGGAAFAAVQLAVDATGNVYATQSFPRGGGEVRQFSPAGELLRRFGTPCMLWGPTTCTGAPGELFEPGGVAADAQGNVYVSDFSPVDGWLGRLTGFAATGEPLWVLPGMGRGRVEVGPDGLVWAIDQDGRRIRLVDPDTAQVVATIGPLLDPAQPILGEMSPVAIGFREHPTLGPLAYVGDTTYGRGRIWRFGLDGTFLGEALNVSPIDLDFDTGGELYLLDLHPQTFQPQLRRFRGTELRGIHASALKAGWVSFGFRATFFYHIVNLGSVTIEGMVDEVLRLGQTVTGTTPTATLDPETNILTWDIGALPPGASRVLVYDVSLDPFTYAPGDEVPGDGCLSELFGTRPGAPLQMRRRCLRQCVEGGQPGVPGCPGKECKPECVDECAEACECNPLPCDELVDDPPAGGEPEGGDGCQDPPPPPADGFGCGLPQCPCVPRGSDPNEKIGLPRGFVRPDGTIAFLIAFENVGEGTVRDIEIIDTLDPNLDASTVIGLSPGGLLDAATQTIRWELPGRLLDPGQGDRVFYVVRPLPGLPAGTELRNPATIVFDGEPTPTNETVHVIDGEPPESFVTAPAQVFGAGDAVPIPLAWQGDDHGLSGVRDFSIFVSDDGGEFVPFLERTVETEATFLGVSGRSYAFFSVARDRLGNAEAPPEEPDAVTVVVPNRPPVALCRDVVVPADAVCLAHASVDAGSFDPDGDPIAVTPEPAGPYGLGSTAVVLTVADPLGAASCTATVRVVDETPPVVDAGLDVIAECSGPAGTQVALPAPTASDNCDPAPSVVHVGVLDAYPLGDNVIIVQATDASGNAASDSLVVRVQDTTPPTLSAFVSPATLWPPNHALVPIVAQFDASDACDTSPITGLVSASSSEPDDAPGGGDGHTTGDVQAPSLSGIFLRAERSGAGPGRTYTLTFDATDASGNRTEASASVVVPHDLGAGP